MSERKICEMCKDEGYVFGHKSTSGQLLAVALHTVEIGGKILKVCTDCHQFVKETRGEKEDDWVEV